MNSWSENPLLSDCYLLICSKRGSFGYHCAIHISLSFDLNPMVRVVNSIASGMGRMKFTDCCSKIPGKITLVSTDSLSVSKSYLQIFWVLKPALGCIEQDDRLWSIRNQSGLYAVLEIWGQNNHVMNKKIQSWSEVGKGKSFPVVQSQADFSISTTHPLGI